MDKDSIKKCKSCKNYDAKKSNNSWTVCKNMPLSVMMSKNSKNCENYNKDKP